MGGLLSADLEILTRRPGRAIVVVESVEKMGHDTKHIAVTGRVVEGELHPLTTRVRLETTGDIWQFRLGGKTVAEQRGEASGLLLLARKDYTRLPEPGERLVALPRSR